MAYNWIVQVAIALVFAVVSYVISPKPKGQRPPEATELDVPTVEGGKPPPVIFGTVWVKSPMILYHGEKSADLYDVTA